MPSRHADRFNHDEEARDYDRDVLREADPIRAGYATTLAWVARAARGARSLLDLGAGTGNLTERCSGAREALCVDVSKAMLERAREKLEGRTVRFHHGDLLAYLEEHDERFDAVVSTYALHHLEEAEKEQLVELVAARLEPGGTFACGDLMFAGAREREALLRELPHLRGAVEEESFWDLERARPWLEGVGWKVHVERFSKLSWGIRGSNART